MNRTGADLEISLSRLYHLEMASSASSEAPRRPSDTPKCFCGPNLARGWHRIRSWAAKRPDRGAARSTKSAGPIVAPTGRSVIISPEATTAGRTPPRVEIFSVDARPFCRADKSADFFAAPAPRAVSLGTRAGREADRSPLTRFSRACPGRRVLVDFWPEARDSPN